jgi:hypothetical protein
MSEHMKIGYCDDRFSEPRVPDAVQRSSRCSAEPGPTRRIVWAPDLHSSKPLRGALLLVRGTGDRPFHVQSP